MSKSEDASARASMLKAEKNRQQLIKGSAAKLKQDALLRGTRR